MATSTGLEPLVETQISVVTNDGRVFWRMDLGSLRSSSCFRLVFPVLRYLIKVTVNNTHICWRMFGHVERFFSTYWALFSSVWGYLGPIWGHVGYVGPMWAYLRLMLGLCWAYLDPFLAYIGPDQEFWPLWKHAKTQDSRAKMPPQAKAY